VGTREGFGVEFIVGVGLGFIVGTRAGFGVGFLVGAGLAFVGTRAGF